MSAPSTTSRPAVVSVHAGGHTYDVLIGPGLMAHAVDYIEARA
jgi:hypothetical protein